MVGHENPCFWGHSLMIQGMSEFHDFLFFYFYLFFWSVTFCLQTDVSKGFKRKYNFYFLVHQKKIYFYFTPQTNRVAILIIIRITGPLQSYDRQHRMVLLLNSCCWEQKKNWGPIYFLAKIHFTHTKTMLLHFNFKSYLFFAEIWCH